MSSCGGGRNLDDGPYMPADYRPTSAYTSAAEPVTPARAADLPVALFETSWLDATGRERWDSLRLPLSEVTEGAVAAVSRGTPVQTPRGEVAIEDLIPGDRVTTPEGSACVTWIGMRAYGPTEARPTLYRVKEQTFGRNRPAGDVVLGAGAHVRVNSPRCRPLVGRDEAFAPIAALEDSLRVIAVQPPGDIATYGIACEGQESILVGGVPIETYHPARDMMRRVTPAMLEDMARLIPPLAQGFGSARIPYLSMTEAQTLQLI